MIASLALAGASWLIILASVKAAIHLADDEEAA